MAVLAKTLLTAVTATGAGTSQDLAAMCRSITMQVIPGGATPDAFCRVRLEASLDGANWFSLGELLGAGSFTNDQDVVQYVRGNVTAIASGNITAYLSFVAG